MNRTMRCFVLTCGLLLLAAPVFAATQNAVVYGTVYDAAGNPMPGATVTLENPALGFTRVNITGSDGSYNFAEVPPAEGYRLTAAKGEKKLDIRAGITVNVGDERVILPPLKEQAAATAAAPVVATAAQGQAVRVETSSTTMSGVITGDQLRSLPLFNRNFLALGLLTPNTHDVEGGSELAGASFSVAGNRPNQNNFLLDGSDNVASGSNQSLPFQVNDSVQEFRVISSDASAEYGRSQGGVVNVVTRRGGNAFHGNVFGYFGNDSLNSDNPLSVYSGSTFDKAADRAGPVDAAAVTTGAGFGNLGVGSGAPQGGAPTTYNEYVATAQGGAPSGVIGFPGSGTTGTAGSVICTDSMSSTNFAGSFPCYQFDIFGVAVANGFGLNSRFDPATLLATNNTRKQPFNSQQFGGNAGGAIIKDKLFAFVSYEGTLIDNPNQIFERVPSTWDKTYNPSFNIAGAPQAAPDCPAAPCAVGQYGFPANDPNFVLNQSILGLFPSANVVGVPGVLEFFRGQAPNYTHVHNGLARLDYVVSDKSSWTFRYAVQGLAQLHDDTLPRQSTYPGNGAFRDALNQNLSIGFSHSFSPTLINELRFGVSRFKLTETAQDANFDATTLGQSSCTLPGNLGTFACNLPKSALPTILLSGLDNQTSGATPFSATGGFLGTGGEALNGASSGWSDLISTMEPTLDSYFPMARLGAPLNAPSNRRDTTWSIADNISWNRGKHAVKLGGEYRDLGNRVANGAWSRGFIYSGNIGQFTSDSETCNAGCGGFFGGGGNAFRAPSFDFAQRQAEAYAGRFHSWALSGYIQDTWRVHPRWTLNFGVRYSYFSVPNEKDNKIWNFDPVANGLVQAGSTQTIDPYGNPCAPTVTSFDSAPAIYSPLPRFWVCNPTGSGKIARSDTNNLAPRVGVAWDVFGTGKTVLRFGFGLYYDQLPVSYASQLLLNRPTVVSSNPNGLLGTVVDFNGTGVCSTSFGACGLGSAVVNPSVQAATSLDTVRPISDYSVTSQPFGIFARDVAHSTAPYSRQINASWQQQITNQLTFELGYVGNAGRQLPVLFNSNFGVEFNTAATTGGNLSNFPVMTITNQGSSSYHSLMARMRAADWHGLRVNATYVWSKSIDNASTSVFPTLPITLPNLGFGYQQDGTSNLSAPCIYGLPAFSGIPPCVAVDPFFTSAVLVSPSFPTIDLSTGAVTTTGAGQVITSRYLIPQDPFNFLKNDRGPSDFNTSHRLVLDYTWEIPGKKSSAFWGNWTVSGILVAQSGQPYTVFAGPTGGELTQRANVLGPVDINNSDPNGAISTTNLQLPGSVAPCTRDIFSPIFPFAFLGTLGNIIQPATGQPCPGNSGRNQFVGPKFISTDLAIQKGFRVGGEGRMLTFRSEFYNILNRDNFYNPISQLSTDGFTLNPAFGKIKSAHDPRQIQFGVRYSW